jgi:mono/diheme cytochrome c family protein
MRSSLKTHLLTIALCSVFLTAAMALGQSPSSGAGLGENPVFKKNCAKCHGKAAKGRHFGGPSLISGKTAVASAKDLSNIITNGKGHMPKFKGKLSAEEIDTLVRQIQALNGK